MNKFKKWYILVFIIAILIRILVALPLVHDWDGFVFSESAKNMLQGITPYETVEENSPIIYPDSDRPMPQQWYAYPPLPLIMFTAPYALAEFLGVNTIPAVENIVLKIPFILGDILFALLVFFFLRKKNVKLAEHAMLLVLFNPLLIWISSVWGMFDIWILNFILLFLLSLRHRFFLLAGFFLALAPEVKLFAVFFLPAIFVYTAQVVKEIIDRIKILSSFVLTTLVIVVPFFLSSPQGFMNQNLLMHLQRPPQGIGFVAISDFFSHVYNFDVSFLATLGGIFVLMSIVAFNLLALVYIKNGNVERLLMVLFLIYTSVLTFNKVVNEQYFVVFVGLLIILNHFPKRKIVMFGRKFLTSVKLTATFTVLFAGVVLGFHFLTFLPSFFSEGYLRESTNNLVFYLSRFVPDIPLYAYPNSVWTYYNLPVAITYLILLPLIISCIYITLRGFREIFLLRKEIYNKIYSYFIRFGSSLTIKKTSAGLLVLIIITSMIFPLKNFLKANNAFTLVDLASGGGVEELSSDPKVGVFYYTWWNNSSLKKDLAGDAWDKVTISPEVGYYTSKNSYFVRHIKQMKDVGIDFAVVSYHLYDRERYLTFADYAEKLNLYYAPLIESDDALSDSKFRPIDPFGAEVLGYKLDTESQKQLGKTILSSLTGDHSQNKKLLRINEKPVVFIYDGHFYFPSWEHESKKELAEIILEKYTNIYRYPYNAISQIWGKEINSLQDIIEFYPIDMHEFNNSNQISNVDYKEAHIAQYKNYWKNIKSYVESEVGPIYLISTYQAVFPQYRSGDSVFDSDGISKIDSFDNEFYYSLSNTWNDWRNVATPKDIMSVWEQQEREQAVRSKAIGRPAILTVTPTYKDTVVRGGLGFEIPQKISGRSVYDWTWEIAIENEADYVLIATWNEFFEGSAIEPSKEYNDFYLKETKRWIERFKK